VAFTSDVPWTLLGLVDMQQELEQHLDIPWTSIAGMRDKLVHGYHGINTQRL
jgi:uncharacterized protein with HEPN domain